MQGSEASPLGRDMLWDLAWAHREIGWVSHDDLLGGTRGVRVGGVWMPMTEGVPLARVEAACRRLWQAAS